MHLSWSIRACHLWGVLWYLISSSHRNGQPGPWSLSQEQSFVPFMLSLFVVISTDLQLKLVVSKLTTLCVNPRHKSVQVLELQPAYRCWFVAQTDKQPIRCSRFWVLCACSGWMRCWIWKGGGGSCFTVVAASHFSPLPASHLLKCSSCLPDVCSACMLRGAKQVNGVVDPLFLRYSNWCGSPNPPQHPWSLNGDRSDRFAPYCPFLTQYRNTW